MKRILILNIFVFIISLTGCTEDVIVKHENSPDHATNISEADSDSILVDNQKNNIDEKDFFQFYSKIKNDIGTAYTVFESKFDGIGALQLSDYKQETIEWRYCVWTNGNHQYIAICFTEDNLALQIDYIAPNYDITDKKNFYQLSVTLQSNIGLSFEAVNDIFQYAGAKLLSDEKNNLLNWRFCTYSINKQFIEVCFSDNLLLSVDYSEN